MFRTLVVDDDADTRLLVRLRLEESGRFLVVGETADARQSATLAADLAADLVLLDLSLPVVDGLSALPLIADAAPGATVVVFSGLAPADVAAAAVAGGAVGYLQKTTSFRGLVDELLALGGLLQVIDQAVAEVRAELAAEPQSARAARRFVDETLARWDCAELLDIVTLLVSELVTNAVVHARSEVEVSVRLLPDAVRIEVADNEPTAPVLRHADGTDTGGRGMELVDSLARAWGIDERDDGKSIWFELPRPDRSPATA